MKAALLFCAFWLPLVATAQRLRETAAPITYHVGLQKAPLYRSFGDTVINKPSFYLPSQAEAVVVGKVSPRWAVAKREGFLYLLPVRALSDYDPEDAAPLPVDAQTQLITYQGVVEVPGVSQADLYARATAWVNQTYNPADREQERLDPATGQLTLIGRRPAVVRHVYEGVLRSSYGGVVRHSLAVYVKEGRYKYVFTNLAHDAAGTPHMQSGGPLEQDKANLFGYVGLGSTKPWVDLKQEATRDVRHLGYSLQEAMTGQKVKKGGKDPRDF
jgi:hypothetical protein